LDESVIEYIDPEEQNYSMIAMKTKEGFLVNNSTYNFTHCEIHPSTIFGVLASCIPFPEHNQAPRNTYQCIGPNELVMMEDSTKKQIKDIVIGDKVLSFDPITMDISTTTVVNQFVRPNEYPLYRIQTTTGREITATEDHKFMTSHGWKTVQDLIQNQDICIGISMKSTNIYPRVESCKIILDSDMFIAKMRELGIAKISGREAVGNRENSGERSSKEFDETINRKTSKIFKYVDELTQIGILPLRENNTKLHILAKIIGFLYADGSINIYSKNRNDTYKYKEFQCAFDFGRETDAIEFQKDIEYCGFKPVKILEGTRTFTCSNSIRRQTHHTYTCIYNGYLPALLISLGLSYGKKTETRRNPIPDWIMQNPEYGKQFMKGFQGGDGCKILCSPTYDKRNKNIVMKYVIRIPQTSQQIHPNYEDSMLLFMSQCVSILRINGITVSDPRSSLVSEFRKVVSFTISSNKDNLINYFDTIGYAYAETKYNHSFKIIEYLRYTKNNTNTMTIAKISGREAVGYRENSEKRSSKEFDEWLTRTQEKNGFLFIPIKNITPEPDGLISDIEVESNNHSFIAASGFASSNCAMGKQAIGVYALNYDQRMDKTAYVLSYPSRPLVDTRLMNFIHLNQIPSGCQIHVAIMTHTGYNQEDSVLVNKGSIDRGLFSATIYHTEKDEDKNIIRDEIIRCNPDKTKTKGIKFGNYDKVNNQGFIPENSLVENRDVIIAKIVPIKENRNDPTKTIKYEDQSKTFRTTEETYIDKNYTGRNGDGYNFAKVRVRIFRKPGYGDKFSSRHGQKGTCGNVIPECDMPFTKEGLRPDIIINPHAIPSRMTIAQLKETLLGKVLLELGMFGDGTSFGNLDIKTIVKELQKLGYEGYGNEVMYNGLTGEQLETSIFIGPVFYQRLKHMVSDKQHSRAIGPMVNLTRQPAEGRSRDGGFRIGEMERDVMIAHGMSKFCRERLYDVSDKYSAYVCRKCGMIAAYNDGAQKSMNPTRETGADFSVHLCNTCNNMTDFARVEIPYAYKLMAQELQTINVVPRLITE
jgi:intein/homing endonuclease